MRRLSLLMLAILFTAVMVVAQQPLVTEDIAGGARELLRYGPVVANLDDDDSLEYVVTQPGDFPGINTGFVKVLDHDGSLITNLNISGNLPNYSYYDSLSLKTSPLVCDMDGDDNKEVLVHLSQIYMRDNVMNMCEFSPIHRDSSNGQDCKHYGTSLMRYEWDGSDYVFEDTLVINMPVAAYAGMGHANLVAYDVDEDGDDEVILSGPDRLSPYGPTGSGAFLRILVLDHNGTSFSIEADTSIFGANIEAHEEIALCEGDDDYNDVFHTAIGQYDSDSRLELAICTHRHIITKELAAGDPWQIYDDSYIHVDDLVPDSLINNGRFLSRDFLVTPLTRGAATIPSPYIIVPVYGTEVGTGDDEVFLTVTSYDLSSTYRTSTPVSHAMPEIAKY
ncbi:hypothetical protein GF324_13985, partial [bacterium]|nr:hypothetical protein [bacterium]